MMHGIARQVAVVSLVILAGAPTHAAEPTAERTEFDRATATHSFADVKYWSSIFDDPRRDEWQKPQALVDALQVRPGMTVADLGAGTGYFSRYLSAAVGPQGAVLAIEIEPTLLTHLRERAEREHSDNLVPVLASADNPRLPSAGVDLN
jgi:predicted methyltransferase